MGVTTREQPLPEGSEHRIVDFADLVALAVAGSRRKRRVAASQEPRIVEAGDEDDCAALERELHQGLEQHLLALTLRVRVARGRADAGSAIATLLDDALAEADVANTVLRELARQLYPRRARRAGPGGGAAGADRPSRRARLPGRASPAPVLPARRGHGVLGTVADVLAVVRGDGAEVAVIVSDRGDHLLVELRSDAGLLAAGAVADRVTAVGGQFHLGAASDGGTLLRAEIPRDL